MQLSSPAEQVQRSEGDAILQMRAPADVQSLSEAHVPAAKAAEGEAQGAGKHVINTQQC
jgi:hypothetical protein